jgi:hypothetical protein
MPRLRGVRANKNSDIVARIPGPAPWTVTLGHLGSSIWNRSTLTPSTALQLHSFCIALRFPAICCCIIAVIRKIPLNLS